MSKNVAVFVDVANIFYAAKAAGVDIDYVTLLKAASAGRDLVRAYAYTGLDPENENQRQFHAFLARNGYKVVSKDIRKYGDGKVKANLDIELVVDLMRTSRNLDIAVVVSGDGDFAPAIRAVQQTGIRVEVISFRGNTSSDLIEVADVFTDITQIARVERSSRSGRRVAAEEEDLSMTEVPDKETEGASRRRRGRHGEGRDDFRREERRGDRRERVYAAPQPVAGGVQPVAGGAPLVALPGEKLSKVAAVASGTVAPEEEVTPGPAPEGAELPEGLVEEGAGEQGQEAGHRRRRRRGGRGRGRGRGQEAGVAEVGVAGDESEPEEELELEAPRVPQHSTFGSVWDSQLGMPTAPVGAPSDLDEEELEEPEIPEYLLSERRQRGAPRGGRPPMGARGGRGRGGAYQQAVERERYGRGAPAPVRGPRGPERGPRPQFDRPDRNRPPREPQVEERQSSGSEPWSEVPPEVAELLRAEMARRGGARPEQPARVNASAARPQEMAAGTGQASPEGSESGEARAAAGPSRGARGRGGRGRVPGATAPAAEAPAVEASGPVGAEPGATRLGEPASTSASGDARSRTRRPRTAAAAPAEVPAMGTATAEPPVAAPARRRGRAASVTAPTGEATPATEAGTATGAEASPSRARGRRSPAAGTASTPAPTATPAEPAAEETAAPRRRARRTETASADVAPVAEEAKAPSPRRTRRAPAVPEA